jgi:hypothetical protein
MEPYFPQISEAIVESMEELKKGNTRNQYKFGAAIYRDQAEGRKRLLTTQPLSSNYSEVSSLLEKFNAGDIHDRDQPEAVFYGLENALVELSKTTDQTNVIVLIGDAGNHHRNDPSQVSESRIVDLLVKNNCHLLAFQVQHESHPSYNDFITQTKSVVMQAAQRRYDEYSQLQADLYSEPEWQVDGSTYTLSGGAYIGKIFGLNLGEKLAPIELKRKIEEFISFIDEYNDTLVEAVLEISDGTSYDKSIKEADASINSATNQYVSHFAPGMNDFLRQQGVTEEELVIIKSENYQIYTEGVAPMYVEGQKYPLFKPVLLFSRMGLGSLGDKLDRLSMASTIPESRERLQKVWVELLRAYIGEEVSNEEIENLSMEEAYKNILGIPITSEFLKNVSLLDITDTRKFSDKDFAAYLNRINEKSREIFEIYMMKGQNYPYSFRSNEITYYWIDIDLLP